MNLKKIGRWLVMVLVVIGVSVWWYPRLALKQGKVDLGVKSEFNPKQSEAVFRNKQMSVPIKSIESILGESILAETEVKANKRIEVDLDKQRLYGYENGVKVLDFLISSGTWNRTPTGTFKIWAKIKSQKMSGGSKELGTYYYLPNVPNIIFFYNEDVPKQLGYSIHGAYWHNNFGKPMSHGCINVGIENSKDVFEWAEMDTPIEIYGKMPIVSLPWAD